MDINLVKKVKDMSFDLNNSITPKKQSLKYMINNSFESASTFEFINEIDLIKKKKDFEWHDKINSFILS